MDVIINWFILIIIFVFDPLAVALVIAFNNAVMVDRGIVKKEKVIRKRELYDEIPEDEDDSSIDKEMAMAHLTNQMGDDDSDIDNLTESDKDSKIESLEETLDTVLDDVTFEKADLNKDGIVTQEEEREFYETTGWKNSHNGNPYFTHPWFDWQKKERWINDRDAINYWLNVKGGNRTALSQFKKEYPTDFTKKTY